MGLKDFLTKTGFVSFNDDENETTPPKKEEVKNTPIPSVVQTYTTQPATVVSDPKMEEHWNKFMNDKNLPGPDYYEFIAVKNAMTTIISPEIKYAASFAGLRVQGLTIEKLIESAEQYKKLIADEIVNFNEAYNKMFAESVTKKEELVKAKSQELAELTQQITTLSNEIAQLNGDIDKNKTNMAAKKQNFEASGNNAITNIDNEISNIKTYIKQQ